VFAKNSGRYKRQSLSWIEGNNRNFKKVQMNRNGIFILGLVMFFIIVACKKNNPINEPPDVEVYVPTPYDLQLPDNFLIATTPEDNPLTIEGVELGRMLFYDPILSGDNTQSCSSCHQQEHSFTDSDQFSKGIDGSIGTRNSMQITNIMWTEKLFWDGRAIGLEQQALEPVENPIEMHEIWVNAIDEITNHEDYPTLFLQAFEQKEITKELVAKAIAQFERTLISKDSKYDKIIAPGGGIFFTDQELNGFDIFNTEKGDCFHCHGSILFTDNTFHNNGLDSSHLDEGLAIITSEDSDIGKFKTPTLRNIALTAPYMHDGRFQTLEEVIDFYSEGLKNSSTIDPLMKNVEHGGIQLTDDEKQDLLAFLHTLTDTVFINNPDFSSPF